MKLTIALILAAILYTAGPSKPTPPPPNCYPNGGCNPR